MTSATRARTPSHLKRFVVDQNYERYTPEDQSVWRYIMRQLKNYLGQNAHMSYLEGLEKTGITVERIPSISHIDERLEKIGWGAVPVSGFIPPAAFMEFQSLGILPIASDMRTLEHLLYTPAPDIVHEAAGHAPILANPEYAAYLRQYGEVARRAILSHEDLAQYEAIRILSDLKEDPASTTTEIAQAEKNLTDINQKMSFVSEAALLSRMNWWTAEYGLIGNLKNPKIFGAGLLSSVGESRHCLQPQIKKIPLSVDCVNFSYDITEPQPQLFVTEDFGQLAEVLDQLANQLSFRRGGAYGLKRAMEAETVNTVELDSGVQISGRLKNFLTDDQDQPCYLQFEGPTQLATEDREIPGQGPARHTHGYSCPVGPIKSDVQLTAQTLKKGQGYRLEFVSGVLVEGQLDGFAFHNGQLILMTFKNCRVTRGETLLFDPAWGEYDMALGLSVRSVFGGPADREHFPDTDQFVAKVIPEKDWNDEQRARHTLFARIRDLRERPETQTLNEQDFSVLLHEYLKTKSSEWLPGIELLEIAHQLQLDHKTIQPLIDRLRPENFSSPSVRMAVTDGLALASRKL